MEELKKLLESSYNIEILSIEKIKNVYKIKTEDGYKCLKFSKYDINQFNFIISAIDHLLRRGFKNILPPYSTQKGDKYIKLDGGYGFLTDWIESREANFKNSAELKLCVKTLAEFHLSSRGFDFPEGAKGRNYYGRWIRKFKKRCDELLYFKALIKSKDSLSQFDNIYLKYFDVHYKQALKAIKDLEESNYLEIMKGHQALGGFCHHDTANHNFLITDDFIAFMIDFDYCIFDSHLHDLSSIIIRNLKYGNWDFERLQFILDIYSEFIPVNIEEQYLIFCFMEFPQDFWQVGLQYYIEKQPWGEDFFIKKLNRIVGDSRDRIDFIEKFRASLMEGSNA
ncbi:CotS family spore coat protein [Fonticella tunisiensis]|uniref:CotS family spore coat protein n=1 Tax=Fonticella tunisiensis TaxID=1096341 RepID=A0A4R7KRU4_9CLOT|nr:CotS family spore coat protein [Fonticella tunisiensis]TDT62315.1 CotS family spore coat protein [Fonticella tunisiensis]